MAKKKKRRSGKKPSGATGQRNGRTGSGSKYKVVDVDSLLNVHLDRGEGLFWVVEFRSPMLKGVHRILSKKNARGEIDSVSYMADLAPDGTAARKRIMPMSA